MIWCRKSYRIECPDEQSAGGSQVERKWKRDNNELSVAAYREYKVCRKISVT
jgi:hypothetical protein